MLRDVCEIFQLRSDRAVNRFLDRPLAQSAEDAGTFIRAIHEKIDSNESVYWAIAQKSTDQLIGTVCLFNFSADPNTAEIGYEVLPSFQRNGVMRESIPEVLHYGFAKLGLHAIEACTHIDNHASTALLHRFGFTTERAADGALMILKLTADHWQREHFRQ